MNAPTEVKKERDLSSYSLNNQLVKKALRVYRDSLDSKTGEGMWEARRVDEALQTLEIREDGAELTNRVGGEWMGLIHNWIQNNCLNGSDVTWGSRTELRRSRPWTVSELEYLAGRIAAAAINEYKGLR